MRMQSGWPMINEIHTATLAYWRLKNLRTINENGSCISIPVKAQIRYMLSGTETMYSWKKAERINTTIDA